MAVKSVSARSSSRPCEAVHFASPSGLRTSKVVRALRGGRAADGRRNQSVAASWSAPQLKTDWLLAGV